MLRSGSRPGFGPFVWVALTALGLLVLVVSLQFLSEPDPDADSVAPAVIAAKKEPVSPAHERASHFFKKPAPIKPPADAGRKPLTGRGPVLDMRQLRPGLDLYREQSREDRENLGDSAYADMERLWKEGRFGGHSAAAFKSLERLIDKYGDSHRADCARYLLARGRLGHGSGDILQRRARAQKLLEPLLDEDSDTRCEQGAQASNLSRLLLATQVYRYEDWERSLQVLEDLSQVPEDQVDDLGMSLARRAQNILQQVQQEN